MFQILDTANLQPGVATFLTILFTVISIPLIVLLYFSIRKERNSYLESKLADNALTKETFDELVIRKLRGANKYTHFTVMKIEVLNTSVLSEVYGEVQVRNAFLKLNARLEKLFPTGSGAKTCLYELNTLMLLLDSNISRSDLSNYASLMILECKKPIQIGSGMTMELDVNIGINSYDTLNRTFDTFIQNLDYALVVAQRSGVNRFEFYSSEINGEDSEEYKYYKEIKEAIRHNEFALYYQTIHDVRTNKIVMVESLLRWNHKTLGVLAPNKFLHIIEQSGDINWVGLWAFEELIKQWRIWQTKYPGNRVVLSMNLSPKQLMNESLPDELKRIAKKYHMMPNNICFEIVEFAMFDRMEAIRTTIERLKGAGFRIAIDDYDIEQNTFAMISQLDLDYIKLERQFVANVEESPFVRGLVDPLITYATERNIGLIAEGIEDEKSVYAITGMGIPFGQGWYYSKPTAPDNIEF